jgi:hypothetical protein
MEWATFLEWKLESPSLHGMGLNRTLFWLLLHAADAGDTPPPPKSVLINVTFGDLLKAAQLAGFMAHPHSGHRSLLSRRS